MFVHTVEGSKWIFVLSTSRSLYVGQKKKGVFQHSSFLSGGATTAAGRLAARDGVLEAIWPYSGHYLPTEENFKEFIYFLEEHHVDLTDVKRCSIDEDSPPTSFKTTGEEIKLDIVEDAHSTASAHLDATIKVTEPSEEITDDIPTNEDAPAIDLGRRLSCKWSTGAGPRIGCVRDYAPELQIRALEQVNLSPRVTPGSYRSNGPIRSPRPSPSVRLSPRLSCMLVPSPRVRPSSPC
ncbi:hypothetical protein GIB67_036065 [Kingdonia uniflora]|nr:hypothetical protein GIB67_036065 [Kingdonia uniflora]